jgi:hypothetical protein
VNFICNGKLDPKFADGVQKKLRSKKVKRVSEKDKERAELIKRK